MEKTIGVVRKYIREVIFGLEDSFVSTVGAITGIAAGAGDRNIVILAGLVIIVVEATSMAAGSYLSNKAARDTERAQKHVHSEDPRHPAISGSIMGISYLSAGIFPLIPYFFLPVAAAVAPSIILTLFMLFLTGAWQTKFTKRQWWKSGFEMLAIGGAAIVIGFIVGRLASNMLGIGVL